MIKKFNEFVNETLKNNPFSGDILQNGNYVSIDAVEHKVRRGYNPNYSDLTELTPKFDYKEELVKKDYPNFIKAVYNSDIHNKNPRDEYIYVIYGDEENGYQFDQFDLWEWDKKY